MSSACILVFGAGEGEKRFVRVWGLFKLPKGGGVRKGALMTGQYQEAGLKTLLMTHLRHEAAQKDFPHDTYIKMISTLWGSF